MTSRIRRHFQKPSVVIAVMLTLIVGGLVAGLIANRAQAGSLAGTAADLGESLQVEGLYKVIFSNEGLYSIWPAAEKNPFGWKNEGFTGTEQECEAYLAALHGNEKASVSLNLADAPH
jgi:uncharacterized protein YbdZ (MbtH family)